MMRRAPEIQVEVQVDPRFQAQVQPDSLRRAATQTLVHQRVEDACELAVVVTDDRVLHDLNRRHRDVDAPTDVLAFPDEPCPERGHEVSVVEGARGPFVDAPGLVRYLGDVVISFPSASAQATEAGHGVEAELQLLVVHGVLHLLGHDDDEVGAQRAKMWTAQSEILQTLGVEVDLPV